GPDRRVPRARAPLRLSAAPRAHRSGHGYQGNRRFDGGAGRAAPGRDRRHHPHLAHSRPRRRPHARGGRRPGAAPDHGAALVLTPGDRVSRVRPHHQHLFPGARRQDPALPARADAAVARALSRRRGHARRGDGLRRQWSRREQAREHRRQPARVGRAAGRARVRRRRENRDAERRAHRRGVPAARRGLRALGLWRRRAPAARRSRQEAQHPDQSRGLAGRQYDMSEPIRAVRGMNDILPDEAERWEAIEELLRDWLRSYGYRSVRTPILEQTALFRRAIGEATDIVEKEMYTFTDELNRESLTLRPEATAS